MCCKRVVFPLPYYALVLPWCLKETIPTKNPESKVTGICRVLGLSRSCTGAGTWYASESRPESITILNLTPCIRNRDKKNNEARIHPPATLRATLLSLRGHRLQVPHGVMHSGGCFRAIRMFIQDFQGCSECSGSRSNPITADWVRRVDNWGDLYGCSCRSPRYLIRAADLHGPQLMTTSL